jgi:hypothetical protein
MLNQNERNAISTLIAYQAERTGLASSEIEGCLLRQFEVDTVAAVKPHSFYEAVHFLTEFDKQGGAAATRVAIDAQA